MGKAKQHKRVVLADTRHATGLARCSDLRVRSVESRKERAAKLILLADLVVHPKRISIHVVEVRYEFHCIGSSARHRRVRDEQVLKLLVDGVEAALRNDIAGKRQPGLRIADHGCRQK